VDDDAGSQREFVRLAPAAADRVLERVAAGDGRLTVLVHCRAGQQRSAAFVAYLLARMGLASTAREAIARVRGDAPAALPEPVTFADALRELVGGRDRGRGPRERERPRG
jgi:protein-tyrosine phosphatase